MLVVLQHWTLWEELDLLAVILYWSNVETVSN